MDRLMDRPIAPVPSSPAQRTGQLHSPASISVAFLTDLGEPDLLLRDIRKTMYDEITGRIAEAIADGREYAVCIRPQQEQRGKVDGEHRIEFRRDATVLLTNPEQAEVGEYVTPDSLMNAAYDLDNRVVAWDGTRRVFAETAHSMMQRIS